MRGRGPFRRAAPAHATARRAVPPSRCAISRDVCTVCLDISLWDRARLREKSGKAIDVRSFTKATPPLCECEFRTIVKKSSRPRERDSRSSRESRTRDSPFEISTKRLLVYCAGFTGRSETTPSATTHATATRSRDASSEAESAPVNCAPPSRPRVGAQTTAPRESAPRLFRVSNNFLLARKRVSRSRIRHFFFFSQAFPPSSSTV